MISAIIVTFHPDVNQLASLTTILIEQLDHIWIIDNTPDECAVLFDVTSPAVTVFRVGRNVGIAKAQNIGIAMAKEHGYEDVILFDQDSIPSSSLIHDLLTARNKAVADGISVAAVGPIHFDIDSGLPSRFVQSNKLSLDVTLPDFKSSYMLTDFIIASGSLINLDVLERVGMMDEELFIDCVDIEWGYRAKAKGLLCIAAQLAKMEHKIGDKPLTLFGRKITTHAPIRHYYFFRNVVLLLKRRYVPIGWKINVTIKSIAQLAIFSVFLPPRCHHVRCITKGFIDGILGHTGPYER